jgi:hypothetical protein
MARNGARAVAVLWIAFAWSSCTAVHTLRPEERLPALDAASAGLLDSTTGTARAGAEPWHAATAADLEGAYSFVAIHGPVAASVLRMDYYFDPAGTYSAAALMLEPDGPRYHAVQDTWTLRDDELRFGNGSPPATAAVAGRRLRLSNELGTLILQH